MANYNPKTKANTPTPIDFDRVVELYESGMTQEEVAREMEVSRKVIYNAMKRNGYKARKAIKRNQKGENNHMWKGGRIVDQKGYSLIRMPEHPRASDGYVYEHVLVMEEHLGRKLVYKGPGHPESEIVHHKNENKLDNDIENLVLTTYTEHRGIHNKINKWGIKHGRYVKGE